MSDADKRDEETMIYQGHLITAEGKSLHGLAAIVRKTNSEEIVHALFGSEEAGSYSKRWHWFRRDHFK